MAHEDIVSPEYTIEKIGQVRRNEKVTKLELEDLVNRTDDCDALYDAVLHLMARDKSRKWRYIKFVDSISVSHEPGMGFAMQWREYTRKKQSMKCK